MNIKKIVFTAGILLGAGTMSFASNIAIHNNKNIKIKETQQPVKYVYSSSKIQYANIATIEKLKKAVVILINKVEAFERELNAKEIKKADLDKLNAKISLSTAKTIDKSLKDIRALASANARKIATIKYGYNSTRTNKISKYDRKIMEFINKEKIK